MMLKQIYGTSVNLAFEGKSRSFCCLMGCSECGLCEKSAVIEKQLILNHTSPIPFVIIIIGGKIKIFLWDQIGILP